MERVFARPRDTVTISAGDGIELRSASVADAGALYASVDRNRARLREWLPWVGLTYGPEDIRRHLEDRQREIAAGESLSCHIWTAGELCGAVSLHRIDPRHRNTSIGYWLDAAHEGRGIMTRACRALVTEGFRHYGLHRIEIRCATGNNRSSAIPRRLGFEEEGILREAEWLYDHWVDLRVFGMLEQDWR
jgi:ribosomal-protein-serine acetyltransferase